MVYYKRDRVDPSKIEYLYFYDARRKEEFSFWLFGPSVGETQGGIMIEVLAKTDMNCPPLTDSAKKNEGIGANEVLWKSYFKTKGWMKDPEVKILCGGGSGDGG